MIIIAENLNYYNQHMKDKNYNLTECDFYCSGDCEGLGCGDNGCYDSCGGDWDY